MKNEGCGVCLARQCSTPVRLSQALNASRGGGCLVGGVYMLTSQLARVRFWWSVPSLLPQGGKTAQVNSLRDSNTDGRTSSATG